MQTALRQTVRIQAGGLIEVRSPELPEGETAEIIILLNAPSALSINVSDEWSEEDLEDITRQSWNNADVSLGKEPDGYCG